jgi:hypothetical protein
MTSVPIICGNSYYGNIVNILWLRQTGETLIINGWFYDKSLLSSISWSKNYSVSLSA